MASNTKNDLEHGSKGKAPYTVQIERSEDLHELSDPDEGRTDQERAAIDRKLMRKVDIYLIPWLSFLYLCSFLDRANIGNARLAGMENDLSMTGRDYNNSLTIFFVSYAIAEAITNVILKRCTPRVFFTAITILWGSITVCAGTVTDYSGLLACRFFLGLAEAGLYPGVSYYLSCWYRRDELGIRAAVFFSAAALAGSFGGLLAAAIAQMDGIGGKSGWAWIFIIEGLATVVVGIVCYWMIYDWPDNARFLTPEDRLRLRRRLAADKQPSTAEEYDNRHILAAFKDWKTWAYAIIYIGSIIPLYAFSLFLPTILRGMGYHSTQAQLLSVPPYACAAVATISIGWLADRTRCRGYCNIGVTILGIAGFLLLIPSPSPKTQYAGTFLAAIGIYPAISNVNTWVANNVEGVYKRGVSMGIVIGCGNLSGIVSSNIYLTNQSPRFWTGHGVVLGSLFFGAFCGSILMVTLLKRENARRLSGKRDDMHEGKSVDEIWIAGDKRPDFIYTI